MKCLLITGPMRSGTSAVAEVSAALGYTPGPTITGPVPPDYRSDWEVMRVARRLMGEVLRPTRDFVEDHARATREWAEQIGFRGVQIKSPYLALHRDAVHEGVVRSGLAPYWIVVRRTPSEVVASFQRQPQLRGREADQSHIYRRLSGLRPQLETSLEELRDGDGVARLARALGVVDAERVADARSRIRKEVPSWA